MSKKMLVCKTCGQEIAKNAKVCPHCGAKNKARVPVFAIIAVVVILIIIVAASGGNDTPTLVDGTTPSQESVESKTPEAFKVGETAELNDIQVCLVNVSESTGSDFNKPSDGNVFVICEFEIANNSTAELNVSSMMSFEAYCDGYACNYSLGALMEKENKNQLDGTVAAGKKLNGVIGYEVPADWKELEVHFTPDVISSKEFVFIASNS